MSTEVDDILTSYRTEIDRITRQRDAAAALALREAAAWVQNDQGRHDGAGVAEWLRARADRIEGQQIG